MKKFLSILLALCIICGVLPMAAIAEGILPEEEFLLPEELPELEEVLITEEAVSEEDFPEAMEEKAAAEDNVPISCYLVDVGTTFASFRETFFMPPTLGSVFYVGVAIKGPNDDSFTIYFSDDEVWRRKPVSGTLQPEERTVTGLIPDTTYSYYGILMGKDHQMLAKTMEQSFHTPPTEIPSDNIANFVLRCYTRGLGRDEDSVRKNDLGGFAYWYDILKTRQLTPAQVGKYFATSPESATKYGNVYNFVPMLYRLYMEDRDYDEAGYQYWLGMLQSGTLNRDQVIDYFGISPEFQAIVASYGLD